MITLEIIKYVWNMQIKSCIGGIIGLIAGIGISNHEKNKLMDKYHVEQY